MRQLIVTAVAAFTLGGITTGVVLAPHAQPAPPGPNAAGGPPPGGPPLDGPPGGPGGFMRHGPGMRMGMDGGPGWQGRGGPGEWGERGHWMHARRMEMMRKFALFHRPDDRKLTTADVQKIAEAFLLWNGNHTWKVLNVKPSGEAIGFDFGAADGTVIASFTMDPKTGHVDRTG